jgi:hypothetical protein
VGASVLWRSTGHELNADTDVLRFEVMDLNPVIATAAANTDLYRPLQDARGHRPDWQSAGAVLLRHHPGMAADAPSRR